MIETARLENTTYNILIALGKEADFLYSTIDTYAEDRETTKAKIEPATGLLVA
jgi:hypothetical protein